MRILTVALALGLASCVNPYRPKVLLDGIEAHHIRQDTWRIAIRGNDFPSTPPLGYFVLLQTAQTTIAHGGTHFIVLNPAANNPFSPAGPGFGYAGAKPSEDLVIKIITVKSGKRAPAGSFDADQVLQFARARLLNETDPTRRSPGSTPSSHIEAPRTTDHPFGERRNERLLATAQLR
jgi:hypothetical protein